MCARAEVPPRNLRLFKPRREVCFELQFVCGAVQLLPSENRAPVCRPPGGIAAEDFRFSHFFFTCDIEHGNHSSGPAPPANNITPNRICVPVVYLSGRPCLKFDR